MRVSPFALQLPDGQAAAEKTESYSSAPVKLQLHFSLPQGSPMASTIIRT